MAVITVASFKGGSGKTTTSLALASEIRSGGASIHLIDADPQKSLFSWWSDWEAKDGITAEDASQMDDIQLERSIETAAQTNQFVIIDHEGTSNDKIPHSSAISDLLIIPQRASALDLERTLDMKVLVKRAERIREGRKTLPTRVLITQRSPAVSSRAEKDVIAQTAGHFSLFDQELFQSEAFRSMFLYRKTLEELEAENITKTSTARASAKSLLAEVVAIIKEKQTS